ncbi:MAG TPA: DegQ family serine endoprotease [Verrucomicrobiae bacterium]|nr:DegQ family serine endoprotease [Verrucomicrobiae bacterium]
MNRLSRPLIGVFSASMVVLAIVVFFYLTSWGRETGPDIKVDSTPLDRDARPGVSFSPVIKKAAPCVVYIYSTRIVHLRQYRNPFLNDPFFRQFFGDQLPQNNQPRTRREESLGSGVVVSPNGYILTANHVVEGADEIKVKVTSSGGDKEYSAKVIGTDPPTDVAVLKIDASDLPAITLGNSDQLEVGDMVLAIGDPFGLEQTVTMGIVSALGRSGFQFGGDTGRPNYQDFIQTDAAINPGNSGGALVDAEGRLVGINTFIYSTSAGNEGIGFAVPVNLARHVMDRLIQGGKVTRGYLGIYLRDLTPNLAQDFHLPDQNGALVNDVARNGPADKAGIKSGDVIVEFNGKKITDPNSLQLMVSESSPGTEATVKVIRDGQPKSFTVKLAELPGEISQNGKGQNSSGSANTDALDGVTVSDLDQQARQELRIPDSVHGALVTEVGSDSNSADAGLQQGDVIVEINRQPVNNAKEAVKLCTQAKGNNILLKIWRRNGDFSGTTYLSVDNTTKQTN